MLPIFYLALGLVRGMQTGTGRTDLFLFTLKILQLTIILRLMYACRALLANPRELHPAQAPIPHLPPARAGAAVAVADKVC